LLSVETRFLNAFTIQEIIMNKFFIATTLIAATLPVTAVAADTDTSSRLGERPAIIDAPREMGEHPAVLVHRNWSKRGYDYASKMYPHPARLTLYAEAPREMGEHPAVLVARTWSKRGYDEASKIASHPALSKAAAGGVPTVAARQEPQSRLER
jgi:hypothetical protein